MISRRWFEMLPLIGVTGESLNGAQQSQEE